MTTKMTNADEASKITMLDDMDAYVTQALQLKAVIKTETKLPTGTVKTIWHYPALEEGDEPHDETVYTSVPFLFDVPVEPVESTVEAFLDAIMPEPIVQHTYTSPLRQKFLKNIDEMRVEIERLNKELENAMRAESALVSGLSSLDRDGV